MQQRHDDLGRRYDELINVRGENKNLRRKLNKEEERLGAKADGYKEEVETMRETLAEAKDRSARKDHLMADGQIKLDQLQKQNKQLVKQNGDLELKVSRQTHIKEQN